MNATCEYSVCFVIDEWRSAWSRCLVECIGLYQSCNEKHLPCDLFPVSPEQVTFASQLWSISSNGDSHLENDTSYVVNPMWTICLPTVTEKVICNWNNQKGCKKIVLLKFFMKCNIYCNWLNKWTFMISWFCYQISTK